MRLLLISQNPLSKTENNGKTLYSFFKECPGLSIFHLYFRPERPTAVIEGDDAYMPIYQLSDQMVIRRQSGVQIQLCAADVDHQAVADQSAKDKLSDWYRLNHRSKMWLKYMREWMWRLYPFKRKNRALYQAIKRFQPDAIFFCAGDACMAYPIVRDLAHTFKLPILTYITDDYILSYPKSPLIERLRRRTVRRQLVPMMKSSQLVLTIGERMKSVYAAQFGVESASFVNLSEDHGYSCDAPSIQTSESRPIQLCYAGGLHYDRDLALLQLISAIQTLHQRAGQRTFHLHIYAPKTISEDRLSALATDVSTIHDPVPAEQIEAIYRASDVLVFVESDHPAAIRATALSLSTKVPEYLSYHLPILTIGSTASASIEYLKAYSFYASNERGQIVECLTQMTPQKMSEKADLAYQRFQSAHEPRAAKNHLLQLLCEAILKSRMDIKDRGEEGLTPVNPVGVKRVLQVVVNLSLNGIDSVVMNLYRHLDPMRYAFDFLIFGEPGPYAAEAEKMGATVHVLPRRSHRLWAAQKGLQDFLNQHPYEMIHVHQDGLSAMTLKPAKKAGNPIRIAHAHSTQLPSGIRHYVYQWMMKRIPKYATHYMACTDQAGEWMFGMPDESDRYVVIKNAIETDRFIYRELARETIRLAEGIQAGTSIFLHVGRLAYAKNQLFMIQVFEDYLQTHPGDQLWIVGKGELEQSLQSYVQSHRLIESVRFLGHRTDVADLMSAADVLFMPSRFEGLPLTCIEAQCTGLPLVVSSAIDPITFFANRIQQIDLDAPLSEWVQALEISISDRGERRSWTKEAIEHGFDLNQQAELLMDTYDRWLKSV